jgi:hypothetical protein
LRIGALFSLVQTWFPASITRVLVTPLVGETKLIFNENEARATLMRLSSRSRRRAIFLVNFPSLIACSLALVESPSHILHLLFSLLRGWLHQVTRAPMTQIMKLLDLAPEILSF